MNFPCDASSSPRKSSYGRSQDTLLIGIPSRRKQPAAAVQWPWVLGRNKLAGEQYLLRFEQDRIKEEEEKSSLKYCSFLSKIASLRLSLQANERVRPGSPWALQRAAEQCHSAHYFKSREYYFTRLETALWKKKLLSISTTFSVASGEESAPSRKPATTDKEQKYEMRLNSGRQCLSISFIGV